MFCLGGFSGGFWQGGFLSRGFLSGGLCLGVLSGGLCPRTPANTEDVPPQTPHTPANNAQSTLGGRAPIADDTLK